MKNKIETMGDKIENWASLYSWEELTSDQKLLVENEVGKTSYEKTWQKFQDLKQLDKPSPGFKKGLMAKAKKTNQPVPWAYISGIAASLFIGIFIGSSSFTSSLKTVEAREVIDTIHLTKTDTIFLSKVDTIYQFKTLYRNIIKKEIVEVIIPNATTDLNPNYKVPMPEYSVKFPKKGRKTKELIIDLNMENEVLIGANI